MTQQIPHRFAATPVRGQGGLTLVELMVALTIGLVMIGAIGMLFVGSSGARREVQSSADAFENARYAMDLLNRELSQAGFYGTWPGGTAALSPNDTSALGPPCTGTDVGLEHVFGWNQGQTDTKCLEDRKTGTDAIFIQRASTCEAGVGSCLPIDKFETPSNHAFLQVAECIDEGGAHRLKPGDDDGIAQLNLRAKNCSSSAPAREFIRRVYYVNQDDVLSYREIGPGGPSSPVELVENIEQLQLAYALDTTGADGSPDTFAPATVGTDWHNVVGVRVWLVARSETKSDRRPSGLVQSFELDDMPSDGLDLTEAYRRSVSASYISFISYTLRRAK